MIQKLLSILSISFIVFALGSNAAATQTKDEETIPISKSKLATVNLPPGAHRINDQNLPSEIKETLAKIAVSGGSNVRQGNSEVILWSGNYAKSKGSEMIKKLETVLQNSGWEYEIGAKQNDFVLFSLFRTAPERRLLFGFFVPSEDIFVFALTEMIRADGESVTSAENQVQEMNHTSKSTDKTNSSGSGLTGKWSRGEGSGFIDSTGKTQYKAGAIYSFEFFPNGTVEYVYDKDVLSILQCRIKETSKARGTVKIEGDLMTINLGAMSSVGSSSCESKNNFNKTLPASTITKKFKIKKMESIFRPDNPVILCFDGQDGDGCFERTSK
jgi:hypothetical protein